MTLWRKLTIDWPCALGDWLWAMLVVAPAAFLDRLTLRSFLMALLRIGFFAFLFVFFQQIMAFDLSFLFFIDVAAYPEIAATIFVFVAAGFAGPALGAAARFIRRTIQNRRGMVPRFGKRQHRNVNALRRKQSGDASPDDEPAALDWTGLRGSSFRPGVLAA